jgi:hypothetical protein
VILEQGLVFDRTSSLVRAAAIRERLGGRKLGDVVSDIRAERER